MDVKEVNKKIIEYWDTKDGLLKDIEEGRINLEMDAVCFFHERLYPLIRNDNKIRCFYNLMLIAPPKGNRKRYQYDMVFYEYCDMDGFLKKHENINIKDLYNTSFESYSDFYSNREYYPAIVVEVKTWPGNFNQAIKRDLRKLQDLIDWNTQKLGDNPYRKAPQYAHLLFTVVRTERIRKWAGDLATSLRMDKVDSGNDVIRYTCKEEGIKKEMVMTPTSVTLRNKTLLAQIYAFKNSPEKITYPSPNGTVWLGRISFSRDGKEK